MHKIKFDTAYFKTPIGTAKIVGNKEGISSVSVMEQDVKTSAVIPESLQECIKQLEEYFGKKRTDFELKLNPEGSEFQKKVWRELEEIPYAKTISYSEQSKRMGKLKAIRAIASANGRNPIWIVIPCHRVIGSDGSLTGYAGGIWRKKWLLEHEKPSNQTSLF